MRKQKTSKPSPRRPKPKKCIECANCKPLRTRTHELYSQCSIWEAKHFQRQIENNNLRAERDESRKQHLVATQRNVELTNELNAANAALQQYMTSYQTYVGRIKEADRTLAQMENQRRAEDAKNCLQWWHCSSTMTIFLAIP